jgi:hypothetical protein
VEQATGRTKRSTAGSWLDGPSNSKSEDFMTARLRIKSNVQRQAVMIESQGIDIAEAHNDGEATSQWGHHTGSEQSTWSVWSQSHESEPQTSEATSSSYTLKLIEAEINNLEQPGVLPPIRYRNKPKQYSKNIIGIYLSQGEVQSRWKLWQR